MSGEVAMSGRTISERQSRSLDCIAMNTREKRERDGEEHGKVSECDEMEMEMEMEVGRRL